MQPDLNHESVNTLTSYELLEETVCANEGVVDELTKRVQFMTCVCMFVIL